MKMAKIESAMRVVLAFNEAFNGHDVAGMMALMSEDCVFESPEPGPDGTVYSGWATVQGYWERFFGASPEAHIEIEEIFGLGMRCVMRWRYDWGDGAGAAGHIRGVDVFQVRDGLIVEKFSYVKG
jgi:limonene-1,2-epoxide hydrolase